MENEKFLEFGVKIPEVLLPNRQVDLYKWAVVACDQYTSEPDYWEEAARIVGEAPSTLNLVFPEAYLGKGAEDMRISQIRQKMRQYLDTSIIRAAGSGLVYVERQTSHSQSRKGLIMTVDLEAYDYRRNSKTLIRATEGTVLERIPPRVKIREGALLELPHIMLLVDDPDRRIIEPLAKQVGRFEKLYDTDLMMRGGHVKGFLVKDPQALDQVWQGFSNLADPNYFNQKYGVVNEPVLLFAVGDGNHSLATAKAVWENIKQDPTTDFNNHPSRFALVEVVNIHDPGLQFEPIHRVLFKISTAKILEAMQAYYGKPNFSVERVANCRTMETKIKAIQGLNNNQHVIGFVDPEGYGLITVSSPDHELEVGSLQIFLDEWLPKNPGAEIDYVHGKEATLKLGSEQGNMGFFLPVLSKNSLFKTVIRNGVLPRKSFSMGEAEEKRFYLECRKIG